MNWIRRQRILAAADDLIARLEDAIRLPEAERESCISTELLGHMLLAVKNAKYTVEQDIFVPREQRSGTFRRMLMDCWPFVTELGDRIEAFDDLYGA